nr:DNA-directed DNA polymerase [Tanacetum cinerariifolium]
MRTRSRSRHNIVEPLRIEFHSQEDQFQEDPPEVSMADNRTMAQLLQAHTVGYEDAIVIPEIAATNFDLKYGLINLVQNKQFFGHDKEDQHAHIRYFNKITSTMRVPNVPNSTIKLMLFPFSLEGAARIWLEKEPPRSILTWDDLVSKFINQFFPPSKMTNLRNEITRLQQRFDESFSEAWDGFNDLLRACPHHGFSELHQLDTFYNALNINDPDSLNSVAGGNFLDKMPSDCLKIIKSKSKVRQSRAKAVVAKVNSKSFTPAISSDVAELKDIVRALLLDKKNQSSAPATSLTPAPVKAVESNCVTCGGTHSYQNCPATSGNVYQYNIHEYVSQATTANYNQRNTGFRPQMVTNQIRPSGFPPVQNNQNNFNRRNNFTQNRGGNFNQSTFNQSQLHRPQANKQIEKFYEIFKDMSFEISFTDALILMPKFASTLKALIRNKEKLSEMARTPMNEHCSAVILNKLPKKLGDPGKLLIPYEFSRMDECLAFADLGASINLMPLSVWKELALLELTPTCMTLELADHSVSKPIGISKDVSVKVGMFHFPADFMVVDFDPDPRVPLILERCFLKTGRALIDVHKGELTLRIENEAITYNLDQTSDFLLFEEANAFLGLEDDLDSPELDPLYYDPNGDIQMLEAILNSDPAPSLQNHEQSVPSFINELKACEVKTIKSSVDEPPEVELKDLPPHIKYAFLEGDKKLPVIIAKELGDEEKAALIKVLKSYKRVIAWKLSDIQEVEKLLDPGLIYPISDSPWVSQVYCIPKKGGFTVVKNEENELIPTRLVTGWRDLPFKLMCDASDFAIGAVLGQRYEKHFRQIHYASKTLTEAESNYTMTEREMLAVVYAFEKFRSYLIMNKCIVHTDHSALKYLFAKKDAKVRLLRWVLLLQEFDFDVLDAKGAENLAADHLSRLEKPYENVLDPKEINETFPLETLSTITFCGDSSALWFADFANYHAGNFIVKGMSS